MPENTTPDVDTRVLDYLLQRRKIILDDLSRLEEYIATERERLTFQKYGVKVGSIVKARGGRLYRVVAADGHWRPGRLLGRPWLVGNPQLKSGAYGTGIHNLFGDWELVDSPAAGRV